MNSYFKIIFSALSLIAAIFLLSFPLLAQSVSVGAGSYSTSLPPGAVGPQSASGAPIMPKVADGFTLPVQTNDFWSSLIFPFFNSPYSNAIFAHPLNMRAEATGLIMGYAPDHYITGSDFIYPFINNMVVGVNGLSASETTTKDYSDWTVTAEWRDAEQSMEATFGHGLPYVYFRVSGGDARISTQGNTGIWFNEGEVLGITVEGKHYGLFAPGGSSWSGNSVITSSLNGQDFFSIAVLPDNDPATLELFRKHAYAFVTGSRISWNYDEKSATIRNTFAYETTLMDEAAGNLNETMTALYRHQWLYTSDEMTGYTYKSSNGVMKLFEGSSFTTERSFSGILPTLPDLGDYNRSTLLTYVKQAANGSLFVQPSYENGKSMARFANLVHIADQIGAVNERDHFLSQLKIRLEDWFTAGGSQEYSFNAEWDVLTGYPSGFGADREINDHHFHSSYAIFSAATIAQYDSAWASQENWGGMVNLLIKDSNNWDRTDEQFPFLRSHDAYAGHSWAAGHADFLDGNNQESSSESLNFAAAAVLWGEATGQMEIRDLGIFLHTTEVSAVEQYWFDVYDEVFPEDYPFAAIGIHWGGKGVHNTWFGSNPEFIHGINLLPVTSASLYLGRHPEYVLRNYNEMVNDLGGSQPGIWKDVFWEYLALADPDLALSYYNADPNYQPFDGESRAHTLHWLYNIQKMGRVDTTIFADIPTYSVFRNESGQLTYVAYNAGSTEREVSFSDGFSLMVPPRTTKTGTSSTTTGVFEDPDLPREYLLEQNYPNPFNPTTQIQYSLPEASQVKLEIYNTLGQRMMVLVNDRMQAGTYTATFDANGMASGLYLYKLTTGNYSSTKKMMLIK